ncbi:hypothetical protein CcaverHIS002_0308740 [Cutaneotrichosporon cavernicola]|uniref:DUF1168-domain-containing protein n=1 Tax=Cutaneotrichosporon cavernicola TaxID=279322 RepID=A0AA48I3X6_9TREE|nr:uncharacterized protein CcaverHIS019_0308590 [Cutaneotrichosporon cavernicola]BEI83006.1 hypothetical protein CcaverHIS002_0308740 [Cutaneotrichosporon cavernicola]BEI90789.1 hypothetical protein CcaverHIS019_0308590 [Cutaneotrichosporon cavernicola]BEI98568.1 hypothetical protein CcaverHIS631_0308670 [Cutaneotrichosporon cavernicola]BEJ06338.1 hypothetical protein CcaverHIS641_0308600 [Cutaneotrichosporon cavernicola]
MPVELGSPSPEPFERSPSPEFGSRGGASGDEPKIRGRRFTENDIQRRRLDKLLANPDKEVVLPEGMGMKMGRTPKDTLKNISGSSAAAGSGEFHIYKQSRRREYERVKAMERQTRDFEQQAAFMARQAERDRVTDEKTARNRAKRQKRKNRGGESKAGKGANGHEPDAKKSKFAGGDETGQRKEREEREKVNTVAEVQAAQAAAAAGDTAERRAEVSITVVDDE